MSEKNSNDSRFNQLFAKVAGGRANPDHFGSCLVRASDGYTTKERVADLLGTEISNIRQVGDSLKGREARAVARQLVSDYERHI